MFDKPDDYRLLFAFMILPLGMKFFNWCGRKIQAYFQKRLPEGRLKRILLHDLHAAANAEHGPKG